MLFEAASDACHLDPSAFSQADSEDGQYLHTTYAAADPWLNISILFIALATSTISSMQQLCCT